MEMEPSVFTSATRMGEASLAGRGGPDLGAGGGGLPDEASLTSLMAECRVSML